MRRFKKMRPLFKDWLLSFLGWGLLAAALGAQFVSTTSSPWTVALRSGLRDWLPWAIFTPLLFRFVSRIPLDRQRWMLALPLHLMVCAMTLLFCEWWTGALDPSFDAAEIFPREMSQSSRPALPGNDVHRPPPPEPGLPPPGAPRKRFPLLHIVGFQLPIYCAIVSVAHALLFYRRSQERDASLALVRLEALKTQLQPHFLFNTLNMIAELVHTEPERADAMLTALSDMLRLTLETSRARVVPLRRELEYVERYLAIMHARFEERLRFELIVEPETTSALVPALALQPLVENAVEHGLKNHPGDGLIIVRTHREGAKLHLTVADNGVGLSKNEPLREGIGIGNIRARLRELYGDAAEFDLKNNVNNGVTVEITLPVQPAD